MDWNQRSLYYEQQQQFFQQYLRRHEHHHHHHHHHHQQQQKQQRIRKQTSESISVQLTLDKKTFQAGSIVYGTISLYVPQSPASTREGFSGIRLLFEGEESVDLFSSDLLQNHLLEQHNIEQNLSCYACTEHFDENIVSIETEVIQLRSPLVPGYYKYPFCWKLPEALPCSMRCKAKDLSTCEVSYHLTAYLCPTNNETITWKNPSKVKCAVLNCSKQIRIVASGDANYSDAVGSPDGTIVEPKSYKIKSWLLKKGSMELGLDTDRTVVTPNSIVTVGITGRNRSSVPVKHLLVRWTETVQWGIPGEERQNQKVLAETIVPMDQLPSWQKRNINQKKSRAAAFSGGEGYYSSSTNSTPVGAERVVVRLQLKNARDSYNGRMMKVEHALQVTVVSKGKCVTRPTSTTLMKVRRQPNLEPTPVMAQVHADGHKWNFQNYQIPANGVSLPEAVAISVDPICYGEQQYSPIKSGSSSCNSSVLQDRILEPVMVMTCIN